MSDELHSVAIDQKQVYEAARLDPDFLAALAMPEVFKYCWPPVFIAVWSWLLGAVHTERTFPRMALGLPRGFGKTTLVKLFMLYCILFTDRKFLLVISITEKHAVNIISDVVDMLNDRNIIAVFGDWKAGIEKDTQDVKKFSFRGRNIIIAGIGAEGSVRGLNLKHARPDVMIFEDVQSREAADSQAASESLYKWLLGTAMKAKDPSGCLTVFIGNMYPTPHSILKKLKNNPLWVKFIAGGILSDGTSLWEQLQPIRQLLEEFQADEAAGHPEIFCSEVLNDESASLNNLIDFSKIPEITVETGDIPQGKFIIIDPSNDKVNSDAVTIAYFEVHNFIPTVMEIKEGRFSPLETIKEAIGLGHKYNCPVIAAESNAYQYSLLFWSNFYCIQQGIQGFQFVPVYSGALSKNTRILNMFKSYGKGELVIHPNCKSVVQSQMRGFSPMRRDNIDGILDCLTYAPEVIRLYEGMISIASIEAELFGYNQSNQVVPAYANSAF